MLISETDKCFGSTSLAWCAVLFFWFRNPTLGLHNADGTIMVSNDDWQSDPTSAALLTANGLARPIRKNRAFLLRCCRGHSPPSSPAERHHRHRPCRDLQPEVIRPGVL
jgi:hypothetical protein